MEKTTNRRKDERLTLLKPVMVENDRGQEVGTIDDISPTGMAVKVAGLSTPTQEWRQRFRIHLDLYLDLDGTCVWVKSAGTQTRIGVRFEDVDEISKSLLGVILGKDGWKL